MGSMDETMQFKVKKEVENKVQKALLAAYDALKEKGYNPIHQIVGYLISGDPAYITSHKDARNIIRLVERDDLLEELVRSYLANHAEE
jgi:uncharacterized protein (UPF0297 family)